jgi:hypothetical protein
LRDWVFIPLVAYIQLALFVYVNAGKRLYATAFALTMTIFYSIIFVLHAGETSSAFGAYLESFKDGLHDAISYFASRVYPTVNEDYVAALAEAIPALLNWLGLLGIIYVTPIVMMVISPLEAITRRLLSLAMGVILLIALNEISQYSPNLRALLRPPI